MSAPADIRTVLTAANPFRHQQVTYADRATVDVVGIHDAQFRQLIELAEQAQRANAAIGVIVWGESGSGKSNLLRRLEGWAGDRHAVFVNFLELLATPERLPRAVLNALVSALTHGAAAPWDRTPLYQMLEKLVRRDLPPTKKTVTVDELRRIFHERATELAGQAGTVSATHPAFALLYGVVFAVLQARSRGGDASTAALAVRRLSGDALDEDEARALEVRPAVVRDPLDGAESLQMLAVLAQLIATSGRPLVLAFDQINNLPREQIAAVARLLHDLNDHLRNVVIVLSEVQEELLKLHQAGVFTQATWDRLSAHKIALPPLTPDQGRAILEARLADVERPPDDALFPLGEPWFRDWLGGRPHFRPRQLIVAARQHWQQLQQAPDEAVDHRPVPVSREQLIDECVDRELAERRQRHRQTPHALPPNADSLCGLVEALLRAVRAVGPPETVPIVERPVTKSAYDLIVRSPGQPPAAVGVRFLATGKAKTTTHALDRILRDPQPPGLVLLVTDERLPLTLGRDTQALGRKHLDELQKRGPEWFVHVNLSFEQYAELEVLEAVARQAADLEIPGGSLHPRDVIASYLRRGWLPAHPLLGRLLAVTSLGGEPSHAPLQVPPEPTSGPP